MDIASHRFPRCLFTSYTVSLPVLLDSLRYMMSWILLYTVPLQVLLDSFVSEDSALRPLLSRSSSSIESPTYSVPTCWTLLLLQAGLGDRSDTEAMHAHTPCTTGRRGPLWLPVGPVSGLLLPGGVMTHLQLCTLEKWSVGGELNGQRRGFFLPKLQHLRPEEPTQRMDVSVHIII